MCKENSGIILQLQASMGTALPKTGQAETGLKQCRSSELEIISGESSDTMTSQIHFSSVMYRFWPVKFTR